MFIIRPSLEDLFMDFDKSSKQAYVAPQKIEKEEPQKSFREVLIEVNQTASWKETFIDGKK